MNNSRSHTRAPELQRRAEVVLAATIAALTVLAVLIATLKATPAGATAGEPAADRTVGNDPVAGWDTNGIVFAVEIVGDTVYLGGRFTEVRSPSGAVEARRNVAALRLSDGELLPFRADTNAPVRAIEGDGTSLWIGGSFSNVNGVHQRRITSVDPVTGTVDRGFRLGLDTTALAIEKGPHGLYVGGRFTRADGSDLARLVRVDPVTGAIDDTFRPQPDGPVLSLAITGDRLVVGGNFTTISGAPRPFVTTLSALDASVTGGDFSATAIGPGFSVDVSPDGRTVIAGLGGRGNRVIAWDADTGIRLWRHVAMGDVQAVRHAGDRVYFGFHEGFQEDTTVKLLAVDAASGELDPTFRPAINSFWGIWAIDASPDAVVAGGEFTIVQGKRMGGAAIFPALR